MKEYFLIFGGAILGALLTWLFGILNESRKDKKATRNKLDLLLAELQENEWILENPHMAGGLAFASFQSAAWNSVKGETQSLDPGLSEKLRLIFSKASHYNDMVEQFHVTQDGRFKGAMEVYRNEMKTLLSGCIGGLRGHLNDRERAVSPWEWRMRRKR